MIISYNYNLIKIHRILLPSFAYVIIYTASLSVNAGATVIVFAPPNNAGGYSGPYNNGYTDGRGVVFTANETTTIDAVGILQNIESFNLSYSVSEVTATSEDIRSGDQVLRSGSSVVSTNGFEYVDFSFSPLLIEDGNSYHIEFTHSGIPVQNFFYSINTNIPFSVEF